MKGTIGGEVGRPGKYELLEGEGLAELSINTLPTAAQVLQNAFTPGSNLREAYVIRASGETFPVDFK